MRVESYFLITSCFLYLSKAFLGKEQKQMTKRGGEGRGKLLFGTRKFCRRNESWRETSREQKCISQYVWPYPPAPARAENGVPARCVQRSDDGSVVTAYESAAAVERSSIFTRRSRIRMIKRSWNFAPLLLFINPAFGER